MFKKINLIAVIFVFIQTHCSPLHPYDSRLHIINHSADTLVYGWSYRYPDTSFLGSLAGKKPPYLIDPGVNYDVTVPGNWEDIFNTRKIMPSDTLEIFLFNAHVINTTPWDTIVAKYLILRRYYLTLDSLKKMNWIVEYP